MGIGSITYEEMAGKLQVGDVDLARGMGHTMDGTPFHFPDGYNYTPVIWHHYIDYLAAGTTSELQFFTAAEGDFVTNLPGGGNGIPVQQMFWLRGVSIDVDPTQNAAGVRIAANAPSGASTAPILQSGEVEAILRSGIVSLRIGERPLVDKVVGLRNFPMLSGTTSFSSSDGGGTAYFGVTQNVAAVGRRGFEFDRTPIAVFPNRSIRGSIKFASAYPMANGGRIGMLLHGVWARRTGTT